LKWSGTGIKLTVPLSVDVVPIALDETDFAFGPFGIHVPDGSPGQEESVRELLTVDQRKRNEVRSPGGPPAVRFNGLDAEGKPKLDFAACDEFMHGGARSRIQEGTQRLRRAGHGLTNLHDGYNIGETGRAWEKKTVQACSANC